MPQLPPPCWALPCSPFPAPARARHQQWRCQGLTAARDARAQTHGVFNHDIRPLCGRAAPVRAPHACLKPLQQCSTAAAACHVAPLRPRDGAFGVAAPVRCIVVRKTARSGFRRCLRRALRWSGAAALEVARQASDRKSHLCQPIPPRAGSSKPLPQEGFTYKIKNQAAVATLLRDRIAIRSFATVWAQSLGQMTHGIDGCFSAPQNQGDGSPSFTCLHSASGSPLGATVRPGVVQLVVAISDRRPRTKGPLRTALLEPSQSF